MNKIQLNDIEKLLIKFCKGHLKDKYPFKSDWVESLKPLFVDIYSWNPDEDNNYHDYLNCIFYKLLDIQLKICDDKSGTNLQLRNIFKVSFNKSISRENELPIERSICELCGIIQNNTVFVNDDARYEL